MTESERVERVILRMPVVRGAVFFLFLCAAWAVGYEYAKGYKIQAFVALAAMLLSFLTLALTFKGRVARGSEPLVEDQMREGARPSESVSGWPKCVLGIEQDKALHTVRSILSQRSSQLEPPQAIWQREMQLLAGYIEERCGALGFSAPGDLMERVMWADRQSLMAKDYADAMAARLARIIESSGTPSD